MMKIKKESSGFKRFHERYLVLFEKYALISHIFVGLIMCFIIEWMARHSFVKTLLFVRDHTISYLYNSFIIYVGMSLALLTKRRSFIRIITGGFFIILGMINGILLLNRVSPFGFTDLYMIGDLLTMKGSKYFNVFEEILSIAGIILFIAFLVLKFIKGKKVESRFPFLVRLLVVALLFVSLPLTTIGLRRTNKLASYFSNLAQGYSDYGYLYGFGTSVFSRGMKKPILYNESSIKSIVKKDSEAVGKTTLKEDEQPNVVVVLLESFFDPTECNFLSFSEDPLPFFHSLQKNYSCGHFISPVVGAGTCNTEFEVLTGMSVNFFGPGEYPQKTILKKVDSCESSADIFKTLGYGTHVVHNNGANFYSRQNAFSKMGFDTFTAKENLDITDYTPLGSWPTDDILIGATKDAMDTTTGKDFVYTITVGTHGNYPTYKVLDDPEIKVTCKGKTEAESYAWEYYVNQLHTMDKWMENYVKSFEERNEPTLLLMFGDHLPSLGLLDSDLQSGSIFKTNYVSWNNFGMKKEDKELAAYQLIPEYMNRLGIHGGTMIDYNQRMLDAKEPYNSFRYENGLESLQYDLLYGKHYAYNGKACKYPATDIQMGIKDITISKMYGYNGKLHIFGDGFTKWSYAYVNGEKVDTSYKSGQELAIKLKDLKDGDLIQVSQVGSGSDILRSSNTMSYSDPAVDHSGDQNKNKGSDPSVDPALVQPDDSILNQPTIEN